MERQRKEGRGRKAGEKISIEIRGVPEEEIRKVGRKVCGGKRRRKEGRKEESRGKKSKYK